MLKPLQQQYIPSANFCTMRFIFILALFTSLVSCAGTQPILTRPPGSDTTRRSGSGTIGDIIDVISGTGTLSTNEVVAGLKQALEIGSNNAGNKLSVTDGFFANLAIKILLPPEAQKVEQTLRNLGMGRLVDNAILSMNRAAEEAAKSAAPIFIGAIKDMTIADGWSILRGSDTAATSYLRGKTSIALANAFRPVIDRALSKTNATRHWNTVFSAYNKFSTNQVNPDLASYVTEKGLNGLFYQLGEEEKDIRNNPLARTTELLKKVFGRRQ